MEDWTIPDKVYALRLFAIQAEVTSVRLRQVVELTNQNIETVMQELGWLPYGIFNIARLTSVEADRLSAPARAALKRVLGRLLNGDIPQVEFSWSEQLQYKENTRVACSTC